MGSREETRETAPARNIPLGHKNISEPTMSERVRDEYLLHSRKLQLHATTLA